MKIRVMLSKSKNILKKKNYMRERPNCGSQSTSKVAPTFTFRPHQFLSLYKAGYTPLSSAKVANHYY